MYINYRTNRGNTSYGRIGYVFIYRNLSRFSNENSKRCPLEWKSISWEVVHMNYTEESCLEQMIFLDGEVLSSFTIRKGMKEFNTE